MSAVGMCTPQWLQACMGLGSEVAAVSGEDGVSGDFVLRSFKAFNRFLRHSQTANKIVSSKSRNFKGCVPK
jgi:hypothetical protein